MAVIYSVRFLAIKGLTTAFSPSLDPSMVHIIRDVDIYSRDLIGGDFFLEGSAGQTIWHDEIPAVDTHHEGAWRGRQVLEPGEGFTVRSDVACDVTVSGYRLTPP